MWNRSFSLVLTGLLLLGAAACSLTDTNEPFDLSFFDTAQPVAYQNLGASVVTLDQSTVGNSDLTARRNHVITNQADFEALWHSLHARLGEPPPVPAVDFSQEMVLAVVLGLRNSGGYGVEITTIAEQKGRLGVLVTEWEPDPHCVTPAILTSPFHVIKLEALSSDVRFLDTRLVVNCEG